MFTRRGGSRPENGHDGAWPSKLDSRFRGNDNDSPYESPQLYVGGQRPGEGINPRDKPGGFHAVTGMAWIGVLAGMRF
jgi:hypothetical protein